MRGRRHKREVVAEPEPEPEPEVEEMAPSPSPVKRGRGRPRKRPVEDSESEQHLFLDAPDEEQSPPPAKGKRGRKGSTITVSCLSFPVTEKDDEVVECRLCQEKMPFKDFRLHNIQTHANIATTTDDPTIPEHKFYERRLKQLAKLKKISVFQCPTPRCGSKYKSSLGLAYHLDTCGKTKEEIEKLLVQCDVCEKKFTFTNLNWHKKSCGKESKNDEEREALTTAPIGISKLKGYRKSAIKARESFLDKDEDHDEDDSVGKKKQATKRKGKAREKDDDYAPTDSFSVDIEFKDHGKRKPTTPSSTKNEFSATATGFLTSQCNATPSDFWNRRQRNIFDPFETLKNNNVFAVLPEDIFDYLPGQSLSVPFKAVMLQPGPNVTGNDVRRLPCFTGATVGLETGCLVYNVGGPVFDLSWHPSGKMLAVACGNDIHEDINFRVRSKRKSSIQVHVHDFKPVMRSSTSPVNNLKLKLVLCCEYGYPMFLKWLNFTPSCWDHFHDQTARFSDSVEKSARCGLLACAFEDGSIRIFCFSVADLEQSEVEWTKFSTTRIPVFGKIPEVKLCLDVGMYPNAGQVTSFDCHEENTLLVAGFSSGVVAVFDLRTISPLLTADSVEEKYPVRSIFPFWSFHGHSSRVSGIQFDPMSSRYFVSASKDRTLKLWDLQFRQEAESKKVGMVQDICWIRGWINLAVSVDAAISNLSSQYNFVRFHQIGSTQPRPNCAEFLDVSSLSFDEGIILQATEGGSVTSVYFDNFWRECDIERNKKKFNVVNILKTSVIPPVTEEQKPNHSQAADPVVVLDFLRDRVKSALPDPKPQQFDDLIRYFPYLRINKISWSPNGMCFAVGYRNGLVSVIPASFETLYR